MTQEEKDILIKDLCARLSYGVKCQCFDEKTIASLTGIKSNTELYFDELDYKEFDGIIEITYCRPYLYPLSSMTEEQLHELREMFGFEIEFGDGFIETSTRLGYSEMDAMFDYFNRNHFDYRGLIPMGLANDATGLNIY